MQMELEDLLQTSVNSLVLLDSLEVPVDRLQVILELRYKVLLSTLQRLPVLHAVLQGLEHAAHAGPQRLDTADGVREGVQVHPDVHHVRHLGCFFPPPVFRLNRCVHVPPW